VSIFDRLKRLLGNEPPPSARPAPQAFAPPLDRPQSPSEPDPAQEFGEALAEPIAPPPLGDEPAPTSEPLAVPGTPDGKERRRKSRINPRPGTRVLIIDDSPTIVALLGRMLKQNQCEILEAGDAETGLALARAAEPDLIYLDIVLPGMNGFTALRHLRRDPATKDVPIIMISGNEQATEQFYVQRIGADDFMKKPFSRAEVFMRLERLLDADLVPRRPAAGYAATPT
jgi:twitching motility two-component system response regulator PilH